MRATRSKLGEMLKDAGLITSEQIEQALEEQRRDGRPIGEILMELNFVSEKDIAGMLAKQFDMPFVSGEKGMLKPSPEQHLDNLITQDIARQYNIVPISRENNVLTLAMVDPSDIVVIDNLKKITGCEINTVIATKTDIKTAQNEFYGEQDLLKEALEQSYKLEPFEQAVEKREEKGALDDATIMAESAPVVKLVDLLLAEAIKARASDIHIEPFENKIKVRYRIDGELYEIRSPSERLASPLVSRIKIMSRMDIAEKRLPQDGAFSLRMGAKVIDFRVSAMPTIFGESIAIRLLDKTSIMLELEDMGLTGEILRQYRESIRKPYGLVFVTGPTGSGKSTTLYATLKEIATVDKNVITIEDPVEYRLEGINQMQVKPQIGLTFASGVRSALRQDPDIIFVGEVRDLETAQACVRAALTGHLVLSTLHTNDASSTVIRMKDIGIESFLVASSLLLVEAQRLVRRLCSKCKVPYKPTPAEIKEFKLISTVFKAKGCEECRKSGYKGRVGIFEVMPMTPALKELVFKNATTNDIRAKAQEDGMVPLIYDGMAKVNAGITSIEEVFAAAYEL